jgi:hypothetical protein
VLLVELEGGTDSALGVTLGGRSLPWCSFRASPPLTLPLLLLSSCAPVYMLLALPLLDARAGGGGRGGGYGCSNVSGGRPERDLHVLDHQQAGKGVFRELIDAHNTVVARG